jgi:hypothetical protein
MEAGPAGDEAFSEMLQVDRTTSLPFLVFLRTFLNVVDSRQSRIVSQRCPRGETMPTNS